MGCCSSQTSSQPEFPVYPTDEQTQQGNPPPKVKHNVEEENLSNCFRFLFLI